MKRKEFRAPEGATDLGNIELDPETDARVKAAIVQAEIDIAARKKKTSPAT